MVRDRKNETMCFNGGRECGKSELIQDQKRNYSNNTTRKKNNRRDRRRSDIEGSRYKRGEETINSGLINRNIDGNQEKVKVKEN